jgi:aminopeptidase N/puromycin-sensitive aminopeptidase
MKRLFLVYTCALVLIATASAQRLPEIATPESYKLIFTPDLAKASFEGDETIQIRMLKPSLEIVLNAAEIDFVDVTVDSAASSQKAKVTLDKEKEQATLAVEKAIQPGQATLRIKYRGILNDQLRGFYLGKQEATDARRAFPSFDEPAYKATFDVTAVVDKGMTVISNTKSVSEADGPIEGKRTIHFATTPKMSSYLVALVVGNFEYIEGSAEGIPIRLYTSPGKKQLAAFALESAEEFLRYYNRYFGIKYPYGKLDLVGLSDFAPGAMENTACITFRESFLLLDDKHSSAEAKRFIASVIAHEMAHQWFGDLVTMQWWDDIWLNEGFATWMSSKPVEAWKPEWGLELSDVRDSVNAMDADSLENTHPIHQQADTPAQILELADSISYDKTASVLRMLESYLGQDTFRAGVNQYLKRHAYGNATAADFWNALAKVSKKPVEKIMPAFVEQPGPPLVGVKLQCSGAAGSISLDQQRYFYNRIKFEAGSNELWQIPVCMKADGATAAKCELLTRKQQTFRLTSCPSWVNANAAAHGYYRSGYGADAVRSMSQNGERALSPAERIMLLSDVWSSVRVNREQIGDFLALVEGMRTERNSDVLNQLVGQLDYIGRYLVSDSDRGLFELWVRQVLSPIAQEIGWDKKPGESEQQSAVRGALMAALGYIARDPEVQAEARKLADRWLDDPASVDSDLARHALTVAASNGDEVFYNKVMGALEKAKTPDERDTLQRALASFSDPKLLQRTLEYALSSARSQDSPYIIGDVMRNPVGGSLAWSFAKAHWTGIDNLSGAFGGGAALAIVGSAGTFCDVTMRDQVRDFFATHPLPAVERTLKQTLERIDYCVDLRSLQQTQLASWLQRQSNQGAN